MRKLLLLLFPIILQAQQPIPISQPYLFRKYITVNDSIKSPLYKQGADTLATKLYVRQNSSSSVSSKKDKSDTTTATGYARNWQLQHAFDTANISPFDSVIFKNFSASGYKPGKVWYENGLLNIASHYPGVSNQVGTELWMDSCRNNTGSTILNGRVVRIIGAQGTRPTIALASYSTNDSSDAMIGVATMDITTNHSGIVTTFGAVRDINTSSFSAGDTMYLSYSGRLTKTKPSTGMAIRIGYCTYSHSQHGIIYVTIERCNDIRTSTRTNITGILKGASGNIAQAIAGTDYLRDSTHFKQKSDTVNLTGFTTVNRFKDSLNDLRTTLNTKAYPIGTLTANKVLVGANGNVVAASNSDVYVTSTGMSIGTSDPNTYQALNVITSTSSQPRGISITNYTNTFSAGSYMARKARGTYASPLPLLSGDGVGAYCFQGWNGARFGNYTDHAAWIQALTTEDWTEAANGCYINMNVTPTGTNVPTNVFNIYSDYLHLPIKLSIGTTNKLYPLNIKSSAANTNVISVYNSSNTDLLYFKETSAGDGILGIYNTSGVEKLRLFSTGTSYFNGGRVGINIEGLSAANNLEVNGTIGFPQTGGINVHATIGTTANGDSRIYATATELLKLSRRESGSYVNKYFINIDGGVSSLLGTYTYSNATIGTNATNDTRRGQRSTSVSYAIDRYNGTNWNDSLISLSNAGKMWIKGGILTPEISGLAADTIRIKSQLRIGEGANYTQIASDGTITLNGTATVFNDLFFPFETGENAGTGYPTFVPDSSYYTFVVDSTGVSKCIKYFTVQMPHDWKEGSTIYPHVHYKHETAVGAPKFIMKYKWYETTGTTNMYWKWHRMESTTGTTNNTVQMAYNSNGISGTGKGISSILIIQVYLSGTPTNVNAYQFDIHYEKDALGSSTETTK